ncbi:N-6 DNA methylase [Sulfobacillus thermosulfidooxidans]|uniref:N-6 DNA methylase n=1 Tax=Sulfobacillus thermosulfidooxidans TaxID=28034 RepID=UPI0012DE8588|nr:N-6 DNA methylase [Sulfobacillus thermosulfidooxidans]
MSTNEAALKKAADTLPVTALVDIPQVKQEYERLTFGQILRLIEREILPNLTRYAQQTYSLPLVMKLLQQHVQDLMEAVSLNDPVLLRIITDRQLLSDIGHLDKHQAEATAKFLASYILLSQILFLRLLHQAQPHKFGLDLNQPVTPHILRRAFRKILEVNYRHIFSIDVFDALPLDFIQDTFALIWGLKVENIRHDLPGRIFHELMPRNIRKMMAAFYTRPLAADLLASLAISRSNATVMDPACGSGTILVAAYKRKLELHMDEGLAGNPHKRYCEEEIRGCDIMPFAAHLTTANLSAMEPGITVENTVILNQDSLQLADGKTRSTAMQLGLFPTAKEAETRHAATYEVDPSMLENIDVVLMNPPFTKVERGIRRFVDMDKFSGMVGGEVGLWGHFMALATKLMHPTDGIFGGVIPINFIRGRESQKIRDIMFRKMTPLYILKPTVNYGFSEWSEYRDIIFVARRGSPPANHLVKFVLVKADLTKLTSADVHHLSTRIRVHNALRSQDLDIHSVSVSEINQHFDNLMWFIGGTDLDHRDMLVDFVEKFVGTLERFPENYVRTGYRPANGVSSFLFMTRMLDASRTEEAFLKFPPNKEFDQHIEASSSKEVPYHIEKSCLSASLRTPVGLRTMSLDGQWDFIANAPYKVLKQVQQAAGFKGVETLDRSGFWTKLPHQLATVQTYLMVVRKVNPFSPHQHLMAFMSDSLVAPSDAFNIIQERDPERAKALCVLMNSLLFFSQFFLQKEESTGRYIDIRLYDLYQMDIVPPAETIPSLAKIYDAFSEEEFPPLAVQFDKYFYARYKDVRDQMKGKNQESAQLLLFDSEKQEVPPPEPSEVRLKLDMAVCQALSVDVSSDELRELYQIVVKEMIVTRQLQRD